MSLAWRMPLLAACCLLPFALAGAAGTTVDIATPMPAPEWAKLERRILADSLPAVKAFFAKYYDERGYFKHVVRWGANDGPDDAFENTAGWPELHALGASDEILQLHLRSWEGMNRQFTEARTTDVPIGRQGMYYKDFSVQSDWMHHGEALRTFNVTALSVPSLPAYQQRARTYAAFYMGEDAEASNYDPQQQAHQVDDQRQPRADAPQGDVARLGGRSVRRLEVRRTARREQLRAVPRALPGIHRRRRRSLPQPGRHHAAAQRLSPRQRAEVQALAGRVHGRLAGADAQNGGVIPSYVALDGTIGGPEGKWWNNAYGWGFSPVNPVTGKREDRNRIPRATVGFANALLVTGDQKYADAWRTMIDAVNAHSRTVDGRTEYPTMRGDGGWYGWRPAPWNVGALELWYWSMKPGRSAADRAQCLGGLSRGQQSGLSRNRA